MTDTTMFMLFDGLNLSEEMRAKIKAGVTQEINKQAGITKTKQVINKMPDPKSAQIKTKTITPDQIKKQQKEDIQSVIEGVTRDNSQKVPDVEGELSSVKVEQPEEPKTQEEEIGKIINDFISGELTTGAKWIMMKIYQGLKSTFIATFMEIWNILAAMKDYFVQFFIGEDNNGYLSGLKEKASKYLPESVMNAFGYLGNLTVGAAKYLFEFAVWAVKNVVTFGKWIMSRPTMVKLFLFFARIIKNKFCSWLSIKLGYIEYKLSTTISRTTDTFNRVRKTAMETLWLALPDLLQTFTDTLGNISEYFTTTSGSLVVTIISAWFPFLSFLVSVSNGVFVWIKSHLSDSVQEGIKDAFFYAANAYVLQSSIKEMLTEGCLKTQTLRIGEGISKEEYIDLLKTETTVGLQFLRNNIEWVRVKNDESLIKTWLQDKVSRDTPLIEDINVDDSIILQLEREYAIRIKRQLMETQVIYKLFSATEKIPLTPVDEELTRDVVNFMAFLEHRNQELKDVVRGISGGSKDFFYENDLKDFSLLGSKQQEKTTGWWAY